VKIPEAIEVRREKWRDIGLGMLIMISVFMLVDGIAKIRHDKVFGWFVVLAGAISLLAWTIKALKRS
jgi:hypothetical protein